MTAPDQTEYVASLGGYNIFTATWKPLGEPKAIVHIVHGYGEHLMHYDDVAPRLTAEGYLVYAHDHFGKHRAISIQFLTSHVLTTRFVNLSQDMAAQMDRRGTSLSTTISFATSFS